MLSFSGIETQFVGLPNLKSVEDISMAHKSGPDHAQIAEPFAQVADIHYQPLMDSARQNEVVYILKTLPKLEYPISSAGELVGKYGANRKFKIAGVTFDPAKALRLMPAYYFPIASAENFAEKIAELMTQKRKQAYVSSEL